MQEIKLNGESMDIVDSNIEKLKEIFPDVFTENKIDFEKLQNVLGNYIETNDERYNFTWAGKLNALRLAQTPSTGTLRPCKEDSKDWDTTENLYIEGDNLEVLKLLQKSYHNKIKMIYIDPPYNTNGDFVYPDDFKDSLNNYLKLTNQTDEIGNKISNVSETDGRYHTNWLNMMYPRLRLARNLLLDDGVLFISIDEREDANLKKICDEIFGHDNFIGYITWEATTQPINAGSAKYQLQNKTEFILVYIKNKQKFEGFKLEEIESNLNYPHNGKFGKCRFEIIEKSDAGTYSRETMKFPILGQYPREGKRWQIGKETAIELEQKGRLEIIDGIVKKAIYPEDELDKIQNKPFWSLLLANNVGTAQIGKDELNKIMNGNVGFDTVKPTSLIKELLKHFENDIYVLDFFAGTSTTADAIMQLNSEDGNRKFILVQYPEILSKNKKEQKDTHDYLVSIDKKPTLTELGKERIRRAGDKIKQEIEDGNKQLKIGEEPKKLPDIGFKVFKLDSSNIKKWTGNSDNIEQELQTSIFNYVEGRTEIDIVYEVMLKCGLDLTYPIEELNVNGKNLYSIGGGAMFVCMDNDITQDIADKIVQIKEQNEIEEPVVVFKDNGFKDDSTKTNIKETLRVAQVKDFITV